MRNNSPNFVHQEALETYKPRNRNASNSENKVKHDSFIINFAGNFLIRKCLIFGIIASDNLLGLSKKVAANMSAAQG